MNVIKWTAIKWTVRALVVVAVSGALLVALVVFNGWTTLFEPDEPEGAAARERSEITVSTLSTTLEAEGELVFADNRPVGAGQGTLTAVASAGQTVEPGDVLFEVDGQPIIVLAGEVPGWRTMASGDVGPDVLQLEQNLAALGYDPEGLMTVDETFTDYTATLVERWQEDAGLPVSGTVDHNSVIFVPTPATVTTASASPGAALVGGATGSNSVLTVSGAERVIRFAVQPGDLDTISLGVSVGARLPDRSTVTAVVSDLSSNGDGSWTATAELTDTGLTDAGPDQLPDGEQVPITVSWSATVAEDVTTVRANALTRLDDGSYVLEVPREGWGTTEFVAVEVGAQSGSLVEIRTELEPGTAVIAP